MTRGYFGIGIINPKFKSNIGTLWRSAYIFGASFIFTIGIKYKIQSTDTLKTFRHIPLFNFEDFDSLGKIIDYNVEIICVELQKESQRLHLFKHPKRCIYLLGAEDGGIPQYILSNTSVLSIESKREFSMNVATAGSIIMYDRFIKS